MGPGLSWHLIKFKYEGFWYFWDEDCWITQWRMDDDD